MTRTAIILSAIVLFCASIAGAELCKKCKGKMYIMSIGKCTKCPNHTSSGAFKLCKTCSKKLGKCECCMAPLGGGVRPAPPTGKSSIEKGSNEFSLDLYAQLSQKEGNVFFSPNSIHTALAMTSAGARGNTEKQMTAVLRLPPSPHTAYKDLISRLAPGEGYKLHTANALWGQKGHNWLKGFLAVTKENYGAGLREVDFIKATEKARQEINSWVEKQTQDKIKELLKPGILDTYTRLVLTNAIYFKGDWLTQFDKKATRDAPFRLAGGKKTDVPMMYVKAKFGYAQAPGVQVLSMPYKGKELSMIVMLPTDPNGLKSLEKGLTASKVDSLTDKLRRTQVRVHMPRFKMTCAFRLKDPLIKMGMPDAFVSTKADFTGMDRRPGLYIGAVIHKAFVDVNEEGTEAAAATAVVMKRESMPIITEFRADRPFLFIIRHEKTGVILFMGRVANPGTGS
jgi:serpin B